MSNEYCYMLNGRTVFWGTNQSGIFSLLFFMTNGPMAQLCVFRLLLPNSLYQNVHIEARMVLGFAKDHLQIHATYMLGLGLKGVPLVSVFRYVLIICLG